MAAAVATSSKVVCVGVLLLLVVASLPSAHGISTLTIYEGDKCTKRSTKFSDFSCHRLQWLGSYNFKYQAKYPALFFRSPKCGGIPSKIKRGDTTCGNLLGHLSVRIIYSPIPFDITAEDE
uniref:F82b n=1 Tax=Epipremnum aureum TaxID=78380 RepID=M9VRW5_9ARAE|nr:F82b [Epipremnum aureum]